MLDLKSLDSVIAMIVVILVLSLIVQSVQSIIKKWFKLKSKSLLQSLDDLFTYVHNKDLEGLESSSLVRGVTEQLRILGRVSLRGKPMIDSIAKEDLIKILGKVSVEKRGADGKTVLDAAGRSILERIDETKVKRLQEQVNTWFETVMQGFEERYTRHMKTVAICISVVVVIVLNANFFEIYQNISTSDVLRSSLVQRNQEVQKMFEESKKNGAKEATQEQLNAEIGKLKDLIDTAPVFGFSPLKTGDISNFFHARGYWEVHAGDRPAYFIKLLVGWAIMVMLLSVGAPFWQDALESLFGIKNLIRKKSDTKNVEDRGGQQKP